MDVQTRCDISRTVEDSQIKRTEIKGTPPRQQSGGGHSKASSQQSQSQCCDTDDRLRLTLFLASGRVPIGSHNYMLRRFCSLAKNSPVWFSLWNRFVTV